MPAVKFTMLMQHVSNFGQVTGALTRIGGWSESWYLPGTDIAAARNLAQTGAGAFGAILPTRAECLPLGSSIVGQRYQIVDPRGPAQSDARFFPGNATFLADIPQVGLLLKYPGIGVGNIRTQIIRALPDAMVTLGEYTPSVAFEGAMLGYRAAARNWFFRGRDLTQLQAVIISITSVGLVTTQAAHGLAINDRVRILKTLTAAGRIVGGLFFVTTVPSATSFTVNVWPHGSAAGGTARKEVIIYPQVAQLATIARVVTKRVGRPFVQYRGRRGRRSS